MKLSMGLWSAARNDPNFDKNAYLVQLKALQNAKPKVYWIGIGTDDFLYKSCVELRKVYDEIGFKYTYRENIGNHDWNSWRLYLSEFAPLCFKHLRICICNILSMQTTHRKARNGPVVGIGNDPIIAFDIRNHVFY